MAITFHNKAELPIECIKTFGVSAKDNEHPIGYFGTGLKYAIAVLLREKCGIKIRIGKHVYSFSKRKQIIRGKEFDFCYMDDHMLAFTTELGKNWDLWQAYRELYSNCMDEHGEVHSYPYAPTEGTSIIVEGEAFKEVHNSRSVFILSTTPKYVLGDVEIHETEEHDGERDGGVFYKGIRVLDLPFKYNYNITSDLTLTEDRTASQYDVEFEITKAITTTNNMDAISDVLTIGDDEDYHETKLNYNKYVKPSDSFMRLMSELKKKPIAAGAYYAHYREDYIGGLPKESLSTSLQKRLNWLQTLFSWKPKDVHVIAMDDDYKIVRDELCLSDKLFKSPHRLAFVYLFACHKMKSKANRSDYQIIADDMLKYFNVPKGKEK